MGLRTPQRIVLTSGAIMIALTLASSFAKEARLLVWNPTPSVPRGLYGRVPGRPAKGEFALAWLPSESRALAAARRYLPLTVPALKPVAAISGDTVCAADDAISINGHLAARRARADHSGRPFPTWDGCVTLDDTQLLLLSTYASDSFDGRYFGPSRVADVIEKVTPLWTFP